MIKFFRRIRQNLLSEGKTSKYFKYAIGEIILVVIGILIALQINNWNEQRKNSKQEIQLVKHLYSDINTNRANVVELNQRLNINRIGIDSLISGLDNKQNNLKFMLFLSQTMRKSDFNKASSGYNIMQNGKASLVSDANILKSVLNLYENYLPDILDRQDVMNNSIDHIQNQFINKLFVIASNDISVKYNDYDVVATEFFEPINFDSLVENVEFKNTLIQLRKLVKTRLAYLNNIEIELEKTITLLESKVKS